MLLCFGDIFAAQVRTLVLLTNVLDCATSFWPICCWFTSSLCIVTMTWLPLLPFSLELGISLAVWEKQAATAWAHGKQN
jgi:hypothetical protein